MIRSTNTRSGPPIGTGHLPREIRRLLLAHGGIISTAELRAVGITQTELALYRSYGALQAVRHGWHCSPATPSTVRLAWRFGGPLACVSAVEYHQAFAFDDLVDRGPQLVEGLSSPLHVCVPSGTARVPSPALLAARWGIPEPATPIIHWSTADARSGDRRAVSSAVAARQASTCPHQ